MITRRALLGSATPSLESFHHARTGKYLLPEDLKAHYTAREFDDDILLPERIDESHLTGEALPRHRRPGEAVCAGSVNAGLLPSVIDSMRRLFAVASAGVPPTNCTMAGAAAGMATIVALYGYIEPHETPDAWPASGIIGLQIHGGPPTEAWYRNISIEELP